MASRSRRLRLASRGSPLARWQAGRVAELLAASGVESSIRLVETEGDRRSTTPIDRLGGRGVFVREVQAAVVRGQADAAVHSAKDLPAQVHLGLPGLVIAAVPERADPRDLLVGAALASLPAGSIVATGSARRRAQLANLRPDLLFGDLRGNIGTRLARVGTAPGQVSAVVMAKAAVDRLGWKAPRGTRTEALPVSVMVPQVAQGAIAVECRADDSEALTLLSAIDNPAVRPLVEAERAFLAELGGGCTLPVGAHARWHAGTAGEPTATDGTSSDGPARGDLGPTLSVCAMIAAHDGRIVLRYEVDGRAADPAAAGRDAARYLLDRAGGRELLMAGA